MSAASFFDNTRDETRIPPITSERWHALWLRVAEPPDAHDLADALGIPQENRRGTTP